MVQKTMMHTQLLNALGRTEALEYIQSLNQDSKPCLILFTLTDMDRLETAFLYEFPLYKQLISASIFDFDDASQTGRNLIWSDRGPN